MADVKGAPKKFYKKFKFLVEIDGIVSAAFEKCGPLEAEVAKIEQWEGGVLIPDKSPGRVTFSDLELTRGATNDLELYLWVKQVVDIAANGGLVDALYKKNLDLVAQDRDGTVLRRWRVYNAWPTKYGAGEWDNTADENVMESLTLTYDYFEPINPT